MQLPRWNNCKNPRTRGKTAQPSISHSGQGLEGKKSSSLPVEGGIFSLTFPFIEQAISLRTRCERNGDVTPVSQFWTDSVGLPLLATMSKANRCKIAANFAEQSLQRESSV